MLYVGNQNTSAPLIATLNILLRLILDIPRLYPTILYKVHNAFNLVPVTNINVGYDLLQSYSIM